MRFAVKLAGLLCACTGSAAAADDPAAAPEMFIDVTANSVSIHGTVSSGGHEAILRDTLARRFADRVAEIDVGVRPALPPGWSLVTDVTLDGLSLASSASATVTRDAVAVRGMTEDGVAWHAAASRIRASLLPGMRLDDSMVEVRRAGSMERQCIELFRTAMRGRRIEFEESSAVLGTATGPLLDELIQIAADCPDSRIEITGHTDGSGSEAANALLSQERANAVAAYFVAGGIASGRIGATGAGAADPLTSDRTAQGRRLNRRIDIELVFPASPP